MNPRSGTDMQKGNFYLQDQGMLPGHFDAQRPNYANAESYQIKQSPMRTP